MVKKNYEVDIKEVLAAIDRNDFEYYNGLTDKQQKALSVWTLMRFTSSCQSHPEHYLMMANAFINENFNDLTNHPELQWKLLCLCGSGTKQYHPWVPPPRKKGKNKVQAFLATVHRNANKEELQLLEDLYSTEELLELAMDTGLSKQEAKKLL